MTSKHCACSCGNVTFDIVGAPLFRIICHCTICQRFNNAAFADVVVYGATSVNEPFAGTVDFNTYKPPPNVQRGNCTKCGDASIEKFVAPLFPKLTIVPAAMHSAATVLPDPVGHMFYDQRIADINDELPKYKGLLASQLLFGRRLFSAKFSSK